MRSTKHEDPHKAYDTSFLLDPNIFLTKVVSNTHGVFYSLNVKDQVSQPTKHEAKHVYMHYIPVKKWYFFFPAVGSI
jgi:hypothetical protein